MEVGTHGDKKFEEPQNNKLSTEETDSGNLEEKTTSNTNGGEEDFNENEQVLEIDLPQENNSVEEDNR